MLRIWSAPWRMAMGSRLILRPSERIRGKRSEVVSVVEVPPDVDGGASLELCQLLRSQVSHPLGGSSQDQRAIWKHLALGDDGASADQTLFTNNCAIEHHGLDTDERAVADCASMQGDLMPDG